MTARDSRTRQTRRDRRKAKESAYRRPPKKPGIVGHGTAKTTGNTAARPPRSATEPCLRHHEAPDAPLVTLSELAKT